MTMGILNKWNLEGAAITDEKVCFDANRIEVIGGVTYYVSWLSNFPDNIIADSTQSNYGAWTAAEKASGRQTIYLSGVPALTDEIVVLIEEGGKVLSLALTTLYFCYYGHGLIERRPIKQIIIDRFLTTAEGAADLYVGSVPFNCAVNYFDWRVNSRVTPNTSVTMQLRDAISGGGSSVNMVLGTVSDAARNSNGLYSLSATKEFTTDQVICVRATNGINCGNIELNLYSL